MKIVAISDTHGHHRSVDVPDGDVLVHAGDITMNGEMGVVTDFVDWIASLPHAHKIVVPGNHDRCFDISQTKYDGRALALFDLRGVHLLVDAARTLEVGSEKIRVYGAPWVSNLVGWAFWDRNQDKFEHAPRDIDLLVTHGPPLGIRDSSVLVPDPRSRAARTASAASTWTCGMGTHFGSRHLARYLNHCPRLKTHVFGHVHEGYGMEQRGEILFANACTCDRMYKSVNPALVIEVDGR